MEITPRERKLLNIIQDLDRCEHGRHRGDTCAGYSAARPRAGCLGGISLGNPFLTPGRPIGYDRSGNPYIMPILPFTTGAPDAWKPQDNSALGLYLEMRNLVEPVLQVPSIDNYVPDLMSEDQVSGIIDSGGWAVTTIPWLKKGVIAVTVGMSTRGLPELMLVGLWDAGSAVFIMNAIACAHAQTIEGVAVDQAFRIGDHIVTCTGPEERYGHQLVTVLGELYGDTVPVIGLTVER
jgi:hypothetical protein